jgi:hypothetical protein
MPDPVDPIDPVAPTNQPVGDPNATARPTSTGLPSNVAAAQLFSAHRGHHLYILKSAMGSSVLCHAIDHLGAAWFLFNILSSIMHGILWTIPGLGHLLAGLWAIGLGAGAGRFPDCADHCDREGVQRGALGHSVDRADGAQADEPDALEAFAEQDVYTSNFTTTWFRINS